MRWLLAAVLLLFLLCRLASAETISEPEPGVRVITYAYDGAVTVEMLPTKLTRDGRVLLYLQSTQAMRTNEFRLEIIGKKRLAEGESLHLRADDLRVGLANVSKIFEPEDEWPGGPWKLAYFNAEWSHLHALTRANLAVLKFSYYDGTEGEVELAGSERAELMHRLEAFLRIVGKIRSSR